MLQQRENWAEDRAQYAMEPAPLDTPPVDSLTAAEDAAAEDAAAEDAAAEDAAAELIQSKFRGQKARDEVAALRAERGLPELARDRSHREVSHTYHAKTHVKLQSKVSPICCGTPRSLSFRASHRRAPHSNPWRGRTYVHMRTNTPTYTHTHIHTPTHTHHLAVLSLPLPLYPRPSPLLTPLLHTRLSCLLRPPAPSCALLRPPRSLTAPPDRLRGKEATHGRGFCRGGDGPHQQARALFAQRQHPPQKGRDGRAAPTGASRGGRHRGRRRKRRPHAGIWSRTRSSVFGADRRPCWEGEERERGRYHGSSGEGAGKNIDNIWGKRTGEHRPGPLIPCMYVQVQCVRVCVKCRCESNTGAQSCCVGCVKCRCESNTGVQSCCVGRIEHT